MWRVRAFSCAVGLIGCAARRAVSWTVCPRVPGHLCHLTRRHKPVQSDGGRDLFAGDGSPPERGTSAARLPRPPAVPDNGSVSLPLDLNIRSRHPLPAHAHTAILLPFDRLALLCFAGFPAKPFTTSPKETARRPATTAFQQQRGGTQSRDGAPRSGPVC